ncbi:Metallo-hydrolase/oxidoreductase [Lichtheimia hyalospora FSU 10163]|nr:Metallo-hydrolase/oxidoreductase [Lichtheimia hyalospora FSU 10163]
MSTHTAVKEMSVTELSKLLDQQRKTDPFQNQIKLIDARERHEIEQFGRIHGAHNIPFSVFKSDKDTYSAALEDVFNGSKHDETTLVVHCMSGRRSHEVTQLAMEMGIKNSYNMVGGFKQWLADELPYEPYNNNHSPWVHTIFEPETETAQYVVADIETKEAYVIDPVLDYDAFAGTVRPNTAKSVLDYIQKRKFHVTKIIDTHVHADHLSAAVFLKNALPSKPDFWIGSKVTDVQKVFRERYNLPNGELKVTGEQFDHLVSEGESWVLGKNIQCSAIHTPGHTPACMSHRIGDAAFVGDTLFMPDIGTARCDFPGGSAEQMYQSVHKMYNAWPNDTRIFVGHDYPPVKSHRSYEVMTTLEAHKRFNVMANENISLDEYIRLRSARDKQLRAPRYIHPSLQTNLRGGNLPDNEKTPNGDQAGKFFKIPVRWEE